MILVEYKNIDTKMFNIETYLDSLPEDIEEIDVSHKGITNLDLNENLQTLYCLCGHFK